MRPNRGYCTPGQNVSGWRARQEGSGRRAKSTDGNHLQAPEKTRDMTEPAPQFIAWLARAAATTRTEAGVTQETVAGLISKRGITIKRFEEGETLSPPNLDRMIAAYAAACGLKDGRIIFRSALDEWMKSKTPLTLKTAPVSGPNESVKPPAGPQLPRPSARKRAPRAR